MAGMTDLQIEKLRSVLEAMSDVRLAVLFGSAATRVLGKRSDLDIGLSLERDDIILSSIAANLERAAGRPVDLVLLDTAPPLLRFEIARDGLALVERERHLWAEFRAHAMIDWWDWAPTARIAHEAMMRRLRQEAGRGPA